MPSTEQLRQWAPLNYHEESNSQSHAGPGNVNVFVIPTILIIVIPFPIYLQVDMG